MPYFDAILAELQAGNAAVAEVFGTYVHSGFWDDPAAATGTSQDYVRAAQRLNSELLREAFDSSQRARSFLDVGCGFGGTIADLNAVYRGVRLVGVTPDERQIGRAHAHLRPLSRANTVAFLAADACALPFRRETFDVVFAIESISHFRSRTAFFVEAHRILRPRGRLLLSDSLSNPWTLPLKILLFFRHMNALRAAWGTECPPITEKGYRRLAARTGFHVGCVRDITQNTLPTYDFLRRFATEFRPSSRKTFQEGSRFIEASAQRGYSRYALLTFTKL